jgi:DNA-binding MarR family transcriptional regulator
MNARDVVDGGDGRVARHYMEQQGLRVARELGLDEVSFLVASNLHWSFTRMRTFYERGPLADDGLSMSGFVTLWALRVNGEMDAASIASEVCITRSSFSGLASRLEDRGLIERREHPTDQRSYLFQLTPVGAEVIERVWPRVNGAAAQLSNHLGEARQRQLAEALGMVADHLESLVNQPGGSNLP